MTDYDTLNRKALLMLQAAYVYVKYEDYDQWKFSMERAFKFLEEAGRVLNEIK